MKPDLNPMIPRSPASRRLLCSLGAAGMGLLCTVAARAQATRVWPTGYASTPGQDAMSSPFTVNRAAPGNKTRSMTTIVGSSLPFGPGSVVTRLGFRRDARYRSVTYQASQAGHLSVYMGAIRSAATPNANMDANWLGAPSLVFDANLDVPAAAPPGTGTAAPFSLTLTLGQPFTYRGGDIAIDLTFQASPGSLWRRDAVALDAGPATGSWLTIGSGCAGSQGFTGYTYPRIESTVPGRTLQIELEGAVLPSTLGLNILGESMNTFAGVPLPFNLQAQGLGSSCFLRCSIALAQPVAVATASTQFSRGRAQWPLPNSPSLVGATLFSQWLLSDPGVTSPTKLTVSNGIAVTLGAPDPNPRTIAGRTIWRYEACGCVLDGGAFSSKEFVPITEFTGTFQ
jgi:hypothetical protein